MNVFSLLQQSASRFGSRGAVYVDSVLVQTYAELELRSLRLAAGLRHRRPAGSRIAIASENRAEYVEILFGAWAAECVVVPIDMRLTLEERVQIIGDSGASTIFASPKSSAQIIAALRCAEGATPEIVTIGSSPYEQLLTAQAFSAPTTDPEASAWLLYAGRWSLRAKGTLLSHRDLIAMTLHYLTEVDGVDEDTTRVHATPMSHGSGLCITPYIARGARQVIPVSSAFWPDEFIDLCGVHPNCGAFLTPPMIRRLRLEAEASGRRPGNLRTIIHGDEPAYAEELKKAIEVFGQIFVRVPLDDDGHLLLRDRPGVS